MNKLYLTIVFIFLLIWGGGVFLTYVTGIRKISVPQKQQDNVDTFELRQKKDDFIRETKRDRERFMESSEDQIQRLKTMNDISTPIPKTDYPPLRPLH